MRKLDMNGLDGVYGTLVYGILVYGGLVIGVLVIGVGGVVMRVGYRWRWRWWWARLYKGVVLDCCWVAAL